MIYFGSKTLSADLFSMLKEVEKKKLDAELPGSGYRNGQNTDQILSSLSHELRTPLSILSSNLQLLKNNRNLDESIRLETFQLFEEALLSVNRLLDQIHFLNLANKGELKKSPSLVSVEELIDRLFDQPHPHYYKIDRIKLEKNLSNEKFCTDGLLLEKIISGLLDNAFKFSTKEILLSIADKDGNLTIEISDQGAGIPEQEIDHIFDPFYRCANVKMISGTGLGLSIVKKSLDCLNGSISVESMIAKGTNFKLKIPADEC